ncbi:MAG: hypothetical protein ACRBBN_06045 [Methyloligellaceae bacterium]
MALILSGCGQSGSGSSPFVPHEFDFDNRQFSIQLPPKASILSSEDKNLVMINLQAGTALSPRITIRKTFTGDASMPGGKSLKLRNAALLDYRVSATNVGAGQPEAFLNGHLTFGGQRYVVSCNIQSKFVTKTHASWCVDYLATIATR